MARLAEIPARLIHGRWDVSGPLDTAWARLDARPKSELPIWDDTGDGGMGFSEAITAALGQFGAGSWELSKHPIVTNRRQVAKLLNALLLLYMTQTYLLRTYGNNTFI